MKLIGIFEEMKFNERFIVVSLKYYKQNILFPDILMFYAHFMYTYLHIYI